jgi:PHP family Zn ribbon phosphoesterase
LNTSDDAVFRKIDLHIHTPESTCYSDKSVTPEQIVAASLAANLDMIAITDHNTFQGIERIRKAAEGQELGIFPGVELSFKSGHFLAIFDVDTPVSKLQPFLTEIGVEENNRGDGTFIIECEIEEVFRKVHLLGGVVIAAHIERWPSGFLESNEPRKIKMEIHGNPYISALEITVAQDKKLWNSGQMRGFPVKRACIQSSDAHSPADIGRRPVFVKMEKLDMASLKSAFTAYDDRIVFPNEILLG